MFRSKQIICFIVALFCSINVSVAQKTKSFDAPFNLWRYPVAKLPSSAKTVSITCESKGAKINTNTPFGGLKHVATNADIKVEVIIGEIKVGAQDLAVTTEGYQYSYVCQGPYSIKVKTANDSIIYDKKWDSDLTIYSRLYQSKLGLISGASKMTSENALTKVIEQLEYILSRNFVFVAYNAEFSLRRITDDDPAYANTDKLLAELQTGVREINKLATTPTSNAKIDTSLKKLAIELNKCDFQNKKAVFNKKIGNAIMESMIVGNLASGNYVEAEAINARFAAENTGFLGDVVRGTIKTPNYNGEFTNKDIVFNKVIYRVSAANVINFVFPGYKAYLLSK
jgi:hypothetical protein